MTKAAQATTVPFDLTVFKGAKKKSYNQIPLGKLVIAIVGEKGSGKSSLAAQFPNSVYMDLEHGVPNGADYLDAADMGLNSWAAFRSFIQTVSEQGKAPVDTVIVDPVEVLWKWCLADGLAARKIKALPDNDFNRTLDAIREEFKRVIDHVRLLSKKGIMGMVIVAHEKQVHWTDPILGEQVKSAPDAGDHSRNNKGIDHYIAAKPHMVLRTLVASRNPLKISEVWDTPKYLIQARPRGEHEVVKDRSGKLPMFMGNSYENLKAAYEATS